MYAHCDLNRHWWYLCNTSQNKEFKVLYLFCMWPSLAKRAEVSTRTKTNCLQYCTPQGKVQSCTKLGAPTGFTVGLSLCDNPKWAPNINSVLYNTYTLIIIVCLQIIFDTSNVNTSQMLFKSSGSVNILSRTLNIIIWHLANSMDLIWSVHHYAQPNVVWLLKIINDIH